MAEAGERQGLASRMAVAGVFVAGAVLVGAAVEGAVELATSDGGQAGGRELSRGATWGIAGPAFLGLYAITVILAGLVVLLDRRRVWSRHRRDHSLGPHSLPSATVEVPLVFHA